MRRRIQASPQPRGEAMGAQRMQRHCAAPARDLQHATVREIAAGLRREMWTLSQAVEELERRQRGGDLLDADSAPTSPEGDS